MVTVCILFTNPLQTNGVSLHCWNVTEFIRFMQHLYLNRGLYVEKKGSFCNTLFNYYLNVLGMYSLSFALGSPKQALTLSTCGL